MKPHNKWVQKIRRSGQCSNCPQKLAEGYGAWWDGADSLLCTKCKPRPDQGGPGRAPGRPQSVGQDVPGLAIAWLRAGELAVALGRVPAASVYLDRALALLDPPGAKVELSYGPADE